MLAGCSGPLGSDANKAAEKLAMIAKADPSDLDTSARRRLLRMARAAACPCKGSTDRLARCAAEKRCVTALFAVRALVRGVRRGVPDAQIQSWLAQRATRKQREIKLDNTPCRGPEGKVTLVVFSDFECPHCAQARMLLEEVEKQAKGRLRVCFKNFPLTTKHPNAELAAQVAMAAHAEGKFWAMHDRLFDNQSSLSKAQLMSYARDVGLDQAKLTKALESGALKRRVANDVAQGETLGVNGTPTMFIDGREVTDPMTLGFLGDWIDEAEALAAEAKK